MKKILYFVLLILISGCETVYTDENETYYECVMVNESSVAVRVEIVVEDLSVKFPASLTLEPNEKYVWTYPSTIETKDIQTFRPPFGYDGPKAAKVYFADCPPVEYGGGESIDRDPRDFNSYKKESVGDNKYEYVYTFTVEDYQNALKK